MAKYLAPVRYGVMAQTENFFSDCEGLVRDMTVLVRTARGIECGQICGAITALDREVKGLGEIIRPASENDLNILRHIHEVKEPEEKTYCLERIREHRLAMKLVSAEHLFSGDKVIFYFIADSRVDFRELVKDLARRFRTRIEMRQIGVRDEARMLADYEHCGRELCCRTFLHNLEPVTMRMAKVQKTTLDPTKISGHCGRLMCCLRYEDKVYTELRHEMPERGLVVATAKLEGEVISQDILRQCVTVLLSDGTRESIPIADIVETRGRRQRPARAEDGPPDRDRRGRDRGDRDRRGPRPGCGGGGCAGKECAGHRPAEPEPPKAEGGSA